VGITGNPRNVLENISIGFPLNR